MGQFPKTKTLRWQLLVWLLTPLLILWFLSSVADYYVASRFVNLAYDRSLLDSAVALGQQVKLVDGRMRVDLPRVAEQVLQSDRQDHVYYRVSGPAGELIAGYRGLPPPRDPAVVDKAHYYDAEYYGQPIRVAALRVPVQGGSGATLALVQVAETLSKRETFAHEILISMLAPQLLLVLVAAVSVWYGVARGLGPLSLLRQEITSRSHRDLSPLSSEQAPQELSPIISAINGLLERLGAALSAQQRFVADAAHQLRTPLAGLKTQSELALRQNDAAEIRHTLRQLHNAAERSAHLVNQLLSLARAEPGTDYAQSLQPIDLRELARETTTAWVPQALEKSIDLGFEETPGPAVIRGDAFFLKEMLGNLLDNAVRYTQPGGQVTTAIQLEKDKVRLSVEDTGPGVPETERERVFERFHRVLGTGADGCGLGLSIVREIAERHGAEVWLGSGADGAGTAVRVLFPRAEGLRPAPQQAGEKQDLPSYLA